MQDIPFGPLPRTEIATTWWLLSANGQPSFREKNREEEENGEPGPMEKFIQENFPPPNDKVKVSTFTGPISKNPGQKRQGDSISYGWAFASHVPVQKNIQTLLDLDSEERVVKVHTFGEGLTVITFAGDPAEVTETSRMIDEIFS